MQIGWTPPVLSEWYSQMEAAAFRRMGEYEDAYGVRWKWERASPTGNFNAVEQQVQTVQSWVQRKFDVVLICTGANFATMQGVYSKALAAGTKIYQFNQPVEIYPVEQLQAISSIGYDNRWQSGYLCGKYIAEKLGGKGKILEITGPPGSDWSAARQIGFKKALSEHPGLTVAGTANGGYLRQQGLSATQDLLTREPDIQAIWGENEDMALGASQALDARGIKQWDGKTGVVVVGADGLVSGMQSIRNGKLTASIDVGSVDRPSRSSTPCSTTRSSARPSARSSMCRPGWSTRATWTTPRPTCSGRSGTPASTEEAAAPSVTGAVRMSSSPSVPRALLDDR